MKKFLKIIPVLALGLIAALGFAGCAETSGQEPASAAATAAMANAVTYSVPDSGCEHDYDAVQTVAATCAEQGYTVYTCTKCGGSYTDNFVAAEGHAFQEITVPATCTHKGYVTHFCTACGYEYSDTFVNEKGHSYSDEVTAPTCTEQGYTTHTCSDCGYSYKDSYVPALGHAYAEVVTEPTCLEGGYTTYTCQNCGDEVVADYTAPAGHAYTETLHPATCVSYGYTEHVCADRGVLRAGGQVVFGRGGDGRRGEPEKRSVRRLHGRGDEGGAHRRTEEGRGGGRVRLSRHARAPLEGSQRPEEHGDRGGACGDHTFGKAEVSLYAQLCGQA